MHGSTVEVLMLVKPLLSSTFLAAPLGVMRLFRAPAHRYGGPRRDLGEQHQAHRVVQGSRRVRGPRLRRVMLSPRHLLARHRRARAVAAATLWCRPLVSSWRPRWDVLSTPRATS